MAVERHLDRQIGRIGLAARDVEDHLADALLGHLLGGVDRGADRGLGLVHIDHSAIAHAARQLMTDAQHLQAAVVIGPRDEAAHFRGADIEGRDQSVAELGLGHGPYASLSVGEFLLGAGAGRLFARGVGGAQHQAIGQAHVDHADLAFEQALLLVQPGQIVPGGLGILLGQAHFDAVRRAVEHDVPAALADPGGGLDAALQSRLGGQQRHQIGGMVGGALADSEGKTGIIVDLVADDLAVMIDQEIAALVLPERDRRTLGDQDMDLVGQAALDGGGADPRNLLDALLGGGRDRPTGWRRRA